MIGWDEIYDAGMDKKIISQVWSGHGLRQLNEMLANDFQVIISNGYYIDLFWSTEKHYLNDPARSGFVDQKELEKNILGGEVPSWAEFNSEEVIDRRIWPRSAALAERFWSDKDIRDVDDMYRRLERVSYQLEELGLLHIRNYEMMLRRLTNNRDISSLKTLADLVEPIEGYKRHRFEDNWKYFSYSPMTRLIDAVPSDAIAARKFRLAVVDYLNLWEEQAESGQELKGRKRKKHFDRLAGSEVSGTIISQLKKWENNAAELNPAIDNSPIIAEIKGLSANLTLVSIIGREAVQYLNQGKAAPAAWTSAKLAELEEAAKPVAELELRIVSAVEDLVRTAGQSPKE